MTDKKSVFVLVHSTGLASRFYVDSDFDEDNITKLLESYGIDFSDAHWIITPNHILNEL